MKSRHVARVSFVLALVLGPLGGHAAAQSTFSPDTSSPSAASSSGTDRSVALIASTVKGIVSVREGEGAGRTTPVSVTTAAGFDPQRFILNGLLVPALDTDAVPLRWVDPRPAIQCRPGTSVRVNGGPLTPGDLVPNAPFELEWHTDGCRPFGAAGPRFDGDVKLTVFREDWGFSAIVRPRDLRIMTPGHALTTAHPGAATMPQFAPEDELLLGQ
jgi:hypothetical protein